MINIPSKDVILGRILKALHSVNASARQSVEAADIYEVVDLNGTRSPGEGVVLFTFRLTTYNDGTVSHLYLPRRRRQARVAATSLFRSKTFSQGAISAAFKRITKSVREDNKARDDARIQQVAADALAGRQTQATKFFVDNLRKLGYTSDKRRTISLVETRNAGDHFEFLVRLRFNTVALNVNAAEFRMKFWVAYASTAAEIITKADAAFLAS